MGVWLLTVLLSVHQKLLAVEEADLVRCYAVRLVLILVVDFH